LVNPIMLIVGPTGSGKSDLAESWAFGTDALIINADAQQVYSSLPTLRATPTPLAHHALYAFLEDTQQIDAVQWARAAFDLIRAHPVSIVVGGTALYVQALLIGIPPVPQAPITQEIKTLSNNELQALVRQHTPGFRFTDRQRLERAAAVYLHTGIPITEWQLQPRKRFAVRVERVAYTSMPTKDGLRARICAMIAAGALDEVRQYTTQNKTLDRQITQTLNNRHTCPIGLKPAQDYIAGLIPYDTMIDRWTSQTYQYARRQRTFFNKLIAECGLHPE
jgi:tRNA dimethylallyltransferase